MAKLWDEPIAVNFPKLFSAIERSGFDELYEDIDGLRLNADNIAYQDGCLSFELLVFYAFPREFVSSFRDMQKAINIIIENADTGQCHHFNLLDPHKRYPVEVGPNFDSELTKPTPGKKISYRQIPLEIELSNPGWGPHLYIRAALQSYNSNILAIDISDSVNLVSFMNGEPFSIESTLEEDDDY